MSRQTSSSSDGPSSRETAAPARGPEFLQVFMARRAQMEALVQRRVGCRATASDLVQELFLRFWRRPQVLQEPGRYLLRSARNLAIDHLRSEQSRQRLLEALPEDEVPASAEATLQAEQTRDRIEQALRSLPERTRHIFLLSRVHGRTYTEIARAMGISVSAVEKHMMRALLACKTHVDGTAD